MNPLDPSAAPGPTSPDSVFAPAGASPQVGLSQDQMRVNLQELMDKIQGKYQDFGAQQFSSDAKSKEQQSVLLRELFDLLQSAGIDPSNPEEVKAFLDKIKQQNPELAQQLETVLQAILGEGLPEAEISPENMNTNLNEAPSQGI